MTVAGGVNYLDDILDSLGVPNAAGDISYTFPQVNREKVMAMDPDIVIVARASEGMVLHAEDFVDAFKGLPLRAIREAKVYELPADVLFHPGPRVLEAARLLGQLLTRERTGENLAETQP
jgi:ABC-type Fe3+-hydroxamate transport system substrate-binding protein